MATSLGMSLLLVPRCLWSCRDGIVTLWTELCYHARTLRTQSAQDARTQRAHKPETNHTLITVRRAVKQHRSLFTQQGPPPGRTAHTMSKQSDVTHEAFGRSVGRLCVAIQK